MRLDENFSIVEEANHFVFRKNLIIYLVSSTYFLRLIAFVPLLLDIWSQLSIMKCDACLRFMSINRYLEFILIKLMKKKMSQIFFLIFVPSRDERRG